MAEEVQYDPAFFAAADAVLGAIGTHLADLGEDELPELEEIHERLLDYAYRVANDPTWAMTVRELDAYEAENGRQ